MSTDAEQAIRECQRWLETVVIGLNFCPFAKVPQMKGAIRFAAAPSGKKRDVLESLLDEMQYLDEHPEIETTLLVLPSGFQDFNQYLDLVDLAEQLVVLEDYEGVYQVASFHPEYCFAGEDWDDPANYTNRSPWPMLHIIPEEKLEQALESYPDPEGIPERNIGVAREKGIDAMVALLIGCRDPE